MRKKVISLLLAALITGTLFSGCATNTVTETQEPALQSAEQTKAPNVEADVSDQPVLVSQEPAEPEPEPESKPAQLSVGALKGPTGAGMALLMERAENGETADEYTFTLASAPDEIVGKVITGELQIAAVPTNVAAVLYAKTGGQVQIAALNTLGVLYILQNVESGSEPITSLEQLRGKTIYATGQAANPEYVLNYLLRKNGLEPGVDVTVEFLGTHDELVALAAAGEAEYFMLPEPNVSAALSKNENLQVVLNLTDEWDKVTDDGSVLTMGCLIVQKSLAEENPDAIKRFLVEYEKSINYIHEDLAGAAALVAKLGIIPSEGVAKKALPNCNIVYIGGPDVRAAIEGYYKVLYDADPTSIGGSIPEGDFYLDIS